MGAGLRGRGPLSAPAHACQGSAQVGGVLQDGAAWLQREGCQCQCGPDCHAPGSTSHRVWPAGQGYQYWPCQAGRGWGRDQEPSQGDGQQEPENRNGTYLVT